MGSLGLMAVLSLPMAVASEVVESETGSFTRAQANGRPRMSETRTGYPRFRSYGYSGTPSQSTWGFTNGAALRGGAHLATHGMSYGFNGNARPQSTPGWQYNVAERERMLAQTRWISATPRSYAVSGASYAGARPPVRSGGKFLFKVGGGLAALFGFGALSRRRDKGATG